MAYSQLYEVISLASAAITAVISHGTPTCNPEHQAPPGRAAPLLPHLMMLHHPFPPWRRHSRHLSPLPSFFRCQFCRPQLCFCKPHFPSHHPFLLLLPFPPSSSLFNPPVTFCCPLGGAQHSPTLHLSCLYQGLLACQPQAFVNHSGSQAVG